MTDLTSLTATLLARTELLVPVLVAAAIFGEWLARAGLNQLVRRFHSFIARLEKKLNRPQRSTATRVYRGIVALLMLVVPALLLGVALSRPHLPLQITTVLLLLAIFGRAYGTVHVLAHYGRAKRGALKLELDGEDFLFPDTHGVLRYLIIDRSRAFAITIVGGSFWFLLGGLPALFLYLTAAVAADQFPRLGFGWAAHALFHLLDTIPRGIAALLLSLAALFVPRTAPFGALRARNWHGVIAGLLRVSLGGLLPGRELPWAGTGTPKLEAAHLLRWVLLKVVATILLLLLLASPTIYHLVKTIT